MTQPEPSVRLGRDAWRAGRRLPGERCVAEETAVALSYNRITHAVMMATPADLEDFAVGFSLAEGIIESPSDIEELVVIPAENGIELRMWVGPRRLDALQARHRRLAGPTGCGLCGLDSLDQAMRPPPGVSSGFTMTAVDLGAAFASLSRSQPLGRATRAVHAAGFWGGGSLLAVREDVGRHNALDKLAGALASAGHDGAGGALLLTSRVSVELVQKAAVLGVPVIAAMSAPTALAVRTAEAAGITLIGIVRDDGFEVFTHAWRLIAEAVPGEVSRELCA